MKEKNNYNELRGLEKNISYTFKNKKLLEIATHHRSYSNEFDVENNERLEFLGDSILEFVMTDHLYKKLGSAKEGDMTKMRSYIVCEDSLFDVAEKLKFAKYIKLGKSQLKSGGVSKPILADMVEAVIAAIYLDSNIEVVSKFILHNLKDNIYYATHSQYLQDYKTLYQEKVQAEGVREITYELISESGPDHDKVFEIELLADGKFISKGIGKSKKEAQIHAAKKALIDMGIIKDND